MKLLFVALFTCICYTLAASIAKSDSHVPSLPLPTKHDKIVLYLPKNNTHYAVVRIFSPNKRYHAPQPGNIFRDREPIFPGDDFVDPVDYHHHDEWTPVDARRLFRRMAPPMAQSSHNVKVRSPTTTDIENQPYSKYHPPQPENIFRDREPIFPGDDFVAPIDYQYHDEWTPVDARRLFRRPTPLMAQSSHNVKVRSPTNTDIENHPHSNYHPSRPKNPNNQPSSPWEDFVGPVSYPHYDEWTPVDFRRLFRRLAPPMAQSNHDVKASPSSSTDIENERQSKYHPSQSENIFGDRKPISPRYDFDALIDYPPKNERTPEDARHWLHRWRNHDTY